MENSFNLIDENWIPVAGTGNVSLLRIFSDTGLQSLGGTPVEKIAIFKLLLAIGQSAWTPADENEWKKLGVNGFQQKVLEYLRINHDLFYLYGDRPFLQMPAIKEAEKIPFAAVKMEIASGNTTVVTQFQTETKFNDAEKAKQLVVLMNFACGGKKTDNSVVLTKGYEKKKSGKFGTSLGFMGYTHSFYFAENLLTSVYVNIFSKEMIEKMGMFPESIGTAPWLKMPEGELDRTAEMLTKSYMGRLISLSRFCLIEGDYLHYSEGISHGDYASNVIDPSVAVDFTAKPKPKVIWCDTSKKPWRQLSSLLAFLSSEQTNNMSCYQLSYLMPRMNSFEKFNIWSGGVRVSSNAGEQYLTGTDDYVESDVEMNKAFFNDSTGFYNNLTLCMNMFDKNEKHLWVCVRNYFMTLNDKSDSDNIPSVATGMYWELCEGMFQKIVNDCLDATEETIKEIEKKIKQIVLKLYDETCARDTARQMEAWAKNRPYNYHEKEKKDA